MGPSQELTPRATAALSGRAAVAASEKLLSSVFDNAPVGITVIDFDGRWLRVNRECCRMLGYEPTDLVGSLIADFTHPDDAPGDRRRLEAMAGGELNSAMLEKRYLHKNGSVVWAQVRAEMIRNEADKPLYVVAHLQDITERRVAQAQRRESDRRLHAIIDNSPSIVTVKGQDHRYQLVNREFQEWCGLPDDHIVGRSAEEMACGPLFAGEREKDQRVLDGHGPAQDEDTLWRDDAERVYLTTRFPLLDDSGQVNAVCATSTDITERREEERAKRERLQSSAQIYEALAQDRFVLQGQPIINLGTRKVEQAELLIRMRRTIGGSDLVPPGEFLPAAERFGFIGAVDQWVIDQAVGHAAAGHRVEVNLSAKTISDVAQVDRIEQVVLASGCPPENLIFEITETAIADHLDSARVFAARLRKLGCSFALDDFGVGHGTFTYLKHLAVDYLKIDLQFVRDLLDDEVNQQVVEAIIGVANQFDIKTVAEGIEDEATLQALTAMGVDYAQGYWIGRPTPLLDLWNPNTDLEQT